MKQLLYVMSAIVLATVLVGALSEGAQQNQGAESAPRRPRAYVTDSVSWEVSGGFGQSNGSGGGGFSGGARPQTAEIIKTFGQRCPDGIINNRKELADYVIILDHEGGKGIARRRNKMAVFSRSGDSIFSDSTRSLGNSVKDACSAILDDFAHNPHRAVTGDAQSGSPVSRAIEPPDRASASPLASTTAASNSDRQARAEIKSVPDAADITVDGDFVGNTPSALKLSGGAHLIRIEKAGFSPWERKVTVSPGSRITINAELQKADASAKNN